MVTRHSDLLGPRSSRPRRPSRFRWWLILLLAVGGLAVGGVIYTFAMVGVAVQQVSNPIPPADVVPEARPAAVQTGKRINVLVLGLDDDRLRSDTMMLVSVDPDDRKMAVLQIPRDTRTMLAGKGTIEKINSAYASGVGDKLFPANLRALKTVEDLLDIDIHYTVVIDLEGFRKTIDEIGGVSMDIPRKLDYDDPEQNLHIHFEPGLQKLNGKQALEFVRWRHNNDGTGYPDGDLGRIRTQQQFLRAVLDELLKPANLPRLPGMAVAVSRYVDSTLEPGRLLSLATTMAAIRKQDVAFAILPGTDAWLFDPHENKRLSYYIPDPEATKQLVDRLLGADRSAAAH